MLAESPASWTFWVCEDDMKVLVTDGDQRPALAVTRSLGRRGIAVLVGEESKNSLASASKYCAGQVVYPSPYRNPEGFYHFLLEFIRQARIDMVIPITDVTMHLILRQKKELQTYTRLPVAEFEAFDFVSNKWALLKYAQELGVPIPQTLFIEGPEDLNAALNQLHYPVVVKPSRSRIPTEGGWLLTHVHYAETETELIRLYEAQPYLRYPSMIQERITGPGVGLFVLFNRGELVTAFSHRRLREKPPSGGVSVLSASIPVDPNLKEHAIGLFKSLGWHGVAMMEYKLEQRTGNPLLMEVNGRFWGSLQLAIDAGMDFPYLLFQQTMEGHVDAPQSYRVGVKSRWLLGDLDHLLLRIFKKDQDLHLPTGFLSKPGTLIQFLKFYQPELHYEILSLKDPRPFLYELSRYLQNMFRTRKIADG